jgi:hypothetical protein
MLPPPLLLVRQLGHVDRVSVPPRSARRRGDHAGPLWLVGRAGRPKPGGLSRHYLWQVAASMGRSHGPDRAQHCARFLKPFLFVFNSKKQFKLPKFIETCRNVQKWKTKFCWTPLGQLYAVGLTKFIFVQYFIVQNYKNSTTKINVYKYLFLQIF